MAPRFVKFLTALALPALVLSACSIPVSNSGSNRGQNQSQRPTPAPAPVAVSREARQCISDLSQAGATYTPLPDRYIGAGCTNLNTVQLTALAGDNGMLAISNLGPATCDVSRAFAGWVRFGVDRAARQILGSPIRSVETFGSFSCRNVAGSSRRSAHATADAIDVSAFVLQDGRRIVLKERWNGGTAQEREFLRTVQASACRRFATVLGPEYNAAHEDHFHLEGVASGKSFCR